MFRFQRLSETVTVSPHIEIVFFFLFVKSLAETNKWTIFAVYIHL